MARFQLQVNGRIVGGANKECNAIAKATRIAQHWGPKVTILFRKVAVAVVASRTYDWATVERFPVCFGCLGEAPAGRSQCDACLGKLMAAYGVRPVSGGDHTPEPAADPNRGTYYGTGPTHGGDMGDMHPDDIAHALDVLIPGWAERPTPTACPLCLHPLNPSNECICDDAND